MVAGEQRLVPLCSGGTRLLVGDPVAALPELPAVLVRIVATFIRANELGLLGEAGRKGGDGKRCDQQHKCAGRS